MTQELLRQAWLRFLWTFALADHLGDASEAVRAFANRCGLPEPPDDADLGEWIDWLETEHRIDAGIHGWKPPSPAPGAGEQPT